MPVTSAGLLIDEQLAGISYAGIYDEPVLLTAGAYEGAADGGAPAGRSQSPVRGLSEDLEDAPAERSRPGEPFVPEGASRPSVLLLSRPRLFADLDGVAGEEAVVLLVGGPGGTQRSEDLEGAPGGASEAGGPGGTQRSEDLEGAPGGASEAGGSGGSGSNLYVAVVGDRQGRAVNIGTALVGDRPQVRSMVLEEGRIRLGLVQQGPEDAACCPSQLVVRTWSLQGEDLAEGEKETHGTLSLAELEEATWVLKGFDLQEPLPEGIEITADFADGQITGSAGCNRYFASFEEIKPGFVKVGPAGATRMMCPGEVMDLEGRYLEHLGNVTRYSFHLGDLILGWQVGGAGVGGPGGTQPVPDDREETGVLLFSPLPPGPGQKQP
jgi:heat shock protein HslJ